MYKLLSINFLLTILVLGSNAQKLPAVQKESVRAPTDIKIDGKFKEWDNKLQAHNPATEISYTIANDDNNLYLVAQVIVENFDKENLVNKILRGGLTLAIQKTGNKDDKNAITITYPISNYAFSLHLSASISGKRDTSAETTNPLVEKNNKLIEQQIKYIGVKCISGVDSLISVYNENNIKAAGLFAYNKAYTLELCLPLKYLNLSASDEPKFAYHIILNGYKRPPTFGPAVMSDGTPDTRPAALRLMEIMTQMDAAASARTDFWGEYTLAKKP